MIDLDAIRAAMLASDPFTQLDRLVRAEIAAGWKVKDIFDAINPLVDHVLDTPGLTDNGEEAFLGTLDALTGNCRADQCYYDPPESGVRPAANGPVPERPAEGRDLSADMNTASRIELLKSNLRRSIRDLLHYDTIEVRVLDRRTGELKPLLEDGMTPQAAGRVLHATDTGNGVTGHVAFTGQSYL